MIQICLVSTVLALAAPAETLHDKLQSIDTGDGAALLELARWCETKQRDTWAVKCYERVIKLDEEKFVAGAMFRLSSIELKRGRYESAYDRLRRLASEYNHSGAKSLLREASSRLTKKQWDLFSRGKKAYGAKDWGEARKLLADAYALAPRSPSKADFVPNRRILLGLSRTVRKIDDDFYRKKVRPVQRSVASCDRKTCTGGFVKCKKCKGTGVGRIRKRLRGGTTVERCTDCNGAKQLFCPTCIGLEFTTQDDKLTDDERKAFGEIVKKARSRKFLKLDLDKAVREIEKLVLGVDQSATLSYFRAGKAKYTLSRSVRNRLDAIPPDKKHLTDGAKRWKLERGLTVRANFLLSYLCEFSQHVEGFDMLRGSSLRISFSRVPSLNAGVVTPGSHPGVANVAPEILSAFPDAQSATWIHVEGSFQKYEENPKEPEKGRIDIRGEVSHDVNFFVWRPEAIPQLEHLGRGPWKSKVGGLVKAYPFDIRRKLIKARPGYKMILVGRFLRDRLGYPRNWFEVWDVKIGLSENQEKAYLALREPVDIEFPPVEARRLGSFMRWYGLKVQFDGVDDKVLVSCRASGRPVGYLLNEIARGMNVDWYFRKATVVFTAKVSKGRARDMKKVLAMLSSDGGDVGDVVVRVGGISALGPAVAAKRPSLPSDPAALARTALGAIGDMDYGTAETCYRQLLAASPSSARRKELEENRLRVRVFDAITGNTPVSHLARGKNLVRITFNPGNGKVTRVVKKLAEDAGSLKIQTSYGAAIKIEREGVTKEAPIFAGDWRRTKRAKLDARAGEVSDASGRDKASGLLSLALYAKTNRFWSQGTGYLDELIARDEFQWLIETYFPSRADSLLRDWRSLTGKGGRKADDPPADVAKRSDSDPNRQPKLAEKLPSKPEELLPFARKHYARGRAFFSRALPGMENSSRNRKRAHDHFQFAREAAESYLKHKSGDEDARRLRRESIFMVQACTKDMGFFD